MNGPLVRLGLRLVVSRRRFLLLVGLACLPGLAALIRLAAEGTFQAVGWSVDFYESVVLTTVIPLVALVLGTTILGAEIDDGTILYILAKPISRLSVAASRLAVAATLSALLAVVAAVLSGIVLLATATEPGMVLALSLGAAAGATVYAAVFLALSLFTSRALVVGLIYVLLWEGVLAGLFPGTRVLSVREYALGISDGVARALGSSVGADLEPVVAVGLSALVVVVALAVATRRLRAFEVRESG